MSQNYYQVHFIKNESKKQTLLNQIIKIQEKIKSLEDEQQESQSLQLKNFKTHLAKLEEDLNELSQNEIQLEYIDIQKYFNPKERVKKQRRFKSPSDRSKIRQFKVKKPPMSKHGLFKYAYDNSSQSSLSSFDYSVDQKQIQDILGLPLNLQSDNSNQQSPEIEIVQDGFMNKTDSCEDKQTQSSRQIEKTELLKTQSNQKHRKAFSTVSHNIAQDNNEITQVYNNFKSTPKLNFDIEIVQNFQNENISKEQSNSNQIQAQNEILKNNEQLSHIKQNTKSNEDYYEKEIIEMKLPKSIEDQLQLQKRNIQINILSYDLVANWDCLNREFLEGVIDCAICYSFIFYHESLELKNGPVAYQCNMCQTNLICSSCKISISQCPFCRRDDSILEPANQLILQEIKQMKFYCNNFFNNQKEFPCKKQVQCENSNQMSPKELFQHYAFECVEMQKFNQYTLLTRDLNICRYYCSLLDFTTQPYDNKQFKSIEQNKKFHCKSCLINDDQKISSILKRQCSWHFQGAQKQKQNFMCFQSYQIRECKPNYNNIIEKLKCVVCKSLPKFSKICNHCRKGILCLHCVRTNLIRYNQCPECCYSQPQYIDLPRNIASSFSGIEVQCDKCIEFYLYSKWLKLQNQQEKKISNICSQEQQDSLPFFSRQSFQQNSKQQNLNVQVNKNQLQQIQIKDIEIDFNDTFKSLNESNQIVEKEKPIDEIQVRMTLSKATQDKRLLSEEGNVEDDDNSHPVCVKTAIKKQFQQYNNSQSFRNSDILIKRFDDFSEKAANCKSDRYKIGYFLKHKKGEMIKEFASEIMREVEWIPLNQYQNHLKECEKCDYCMKFCTICKANIKQINWKAHQVRCEKDQGVRVQLNENQMVNPDFQSIFRNRNNQIFEIQNCFLKFTKIYGHMIRQNTHWFISSRNHYYQIGDQGIPLKKCLLFTIILDFLFQLMFIGSGIVLIIQDLILPNQGWTMQPLKISFISIFGVLYYVSSTICILLSCFYHYLNARRDYPYSWPELANTTFMEFICVCIWFLSIFFHGHFISLIFLGGLIPFKKLPLLPRYPQNFRDLNYKMKSQMQVRYVAQLVLFIPLILVVCMNAQININAQFTESSGNSISVSNMVISKQFEFSPNNLEIIFLASYSTLMLTSPFFLRQLR